MIRFKIVLILSIITMTILTGIYVQKQYEKKDTNIQQLEYQITQMQEQMKAYEKKAEFYEQAYTQQKELTEEKEKDIEKLENQISHRKEQIRIASRSQNNELQSAITTLKQGGFVKVEATAYTAFDYPTMTGITYTDVDVRTKTPNIIAVDPRVIPLHSLVEVIVDGKSLGMFYAEDTGSAIKGLKIDVLHSNRADALKFGRRYDTIIRIVELPNENHKHSELPLFQ